MDVTHRANTLQVVIEIAESKENDMIVYPVHKPWRPIFHQRNMCGFEHPPKPMELLGVQS